MLRDVCEHMQEELSLSRHASNVVDSVYTHMHTFTRVNTHRNSMIHAISPGLPGPVRKSAIHQKESRYEIHLYFLQYMSEFNDTCYDSCTKLIYTCCNTLRNSMIHVTICVRNPLIHAITHREHGQFRSLYLL